MSRSRTSPQEARRAAHALGVADRVTVETRDVCTLEGERAFDTIPWSQMFFPPSSRGPAIDVLRRMLRPGGVLLMPLMPDLPDPDATSRDRPTHVLRAAAVAYRRCGIHWLPESEIVAELEAAGFRFLRTVPHVRGTPFVAMRSPV